MAALQRYPVGQKHSSKSLYLARFSRYKHFFVLQLLRKIRKFKMPPFWARQKFLEIGMAALQRYPVGQKFRQNRSISHSFRDRSIFVFSVFGKFVMIN